MAIYQNNAAGARGLAMKDGSTVWIDPGASVEVDPSNVDHFNEDVSEAGEDKPAKAPAKTAAKAKADDADA